MALSEKQYLDRQASDARDAIRQTLSDMGRDLGEVADPRTWTRQYPWFGLLGGTAAGFALAAVLTPSREQSVKEKLTQIRDQVSALADKVSGSSGKPKKKGSLLSRAAKSGFSSLLGVLTHALVGAVAGKTAGSSGGDHNGHPAPEAAQV